LSALRTTVGRRGYEGMRAWTYVDCLQVKDQVAMAHAEHF
jgi:hypothetical protein